MVIVDMDQPALIVMRLLCVKMNHVTLSSALNDTLRSADIRQTLVAVSSALSVPTSTRIMLMKKYVKALQTYKTIFFNLKQITRN